MTPEQAGDRMVKSIRDTAQIAAKVSELGDTGLLTAVSVLYGQLQTVAPDDLPEECRSEFLELRRLVEASAGNADGWLHVVIRKRLGL